MSLDVRMSGDNAKPRAIEGTPRLEWQSELDSALAAIDSRLTHPRRRATDTPIDQRPSLPALGHDGVTSELLDEIAWRVAEEIRRNPPASLAGPAPPAVPPADDQKPPALREGKLLLIRYRMPVLPWPFRLLQRRRRKKQHPLTTARVSP